MIVEINGETSIIKSPDVDARILVANLAAGLGNNIIEVDFKIMNKKDRGALKNKLKIINQARGPRKVLPTKIVPDKKKKILENLVDKEAELR